MTSIKHSYQKRLKEVLMSKTVHVVADIDTSEGRYRPVTAFYSPKKAEALVTKLNEGRPPEPWAGPALVWAVQIEDAR